MLLKTFMLVEGPSVNVFTLDVEGIYLKMGERILH